MADGLSEENAALLPKAGLAIGAPEMLKADDPIRGLSAGMLNRLLDAARAEAVRLHTNALPDEIELFRIIKRSGARKRIDIVRSILSAMKGWEG